MDMGDSSWLSAGVCDVAFAGSRKSDCFFFRRLVPQVFLKQAVDEHVWLFGQNMPFPVATILLTSKFKSETIL